MPDRSVLRAGSAAAVVGAILAVVFNILHPRTTENPDDPVAELRLIADSGIWLFDHVALFVAVIVAFFGLWAVSRSLAKEPGASWAKAAFITAVVGTGVLLVTLAVDGISTKTLADEWAEAGGSTDSAIYSAARGSLEVGVALFTMTILTFFTVTPILFGVALRTDDTYPAWLGWVALLSGLVGGVAGFIQAFAGFTVVGTLVLFTIASIAFTVWLLIVGAMLWGKTSRAAVAPAVGASPTS